MRNGYITQVLTTVDIQKNVKIGGKVVQLYQGVIYRKKFEINPFENVIDKLFALTQKCKNETKKQNTSQLTTNLKKTSYVDKEIQDITKEDYPIKRNLNRTISFSFVLARTFDRARTFTKHLIGVLFAGIQ